MPFPSCALVQLYVQILVHLIVRAVLCTIRPASCLVLLWLQATLPSCLPWVKI